MVPSMFSIEGALSHLMNADAWKVTADRTLCSDGTADGILNALTEAEADYFFFVLVG